jgi:hypothetical protein
MQLITNTISLAELEVMAQKMFNYLVKAVIDIEKNIMVVDADMHSDEEMYMLEELESEQKNLWGINLHPDKFGTPEFIEFDSMINLRPSWGNRTRSVDDPKIQEKIRQIVKGLVS